MPRVVPSDLSGHKLSKVVLAEHSRLFLLCISRQVTGNPALIFASKNTEDQINFTRGEEKGKQATHQVYLLEPETFKLH